MKQIYYILLAVLFVSVVGYFIYRKCNNNENFQTFAARYTQPIGDGQLRDPMHLAATVFRASNTILTAANVFNDKMDTLTLPEEVQDEFNEWIDKGFVSQVKDQMLCGGCWAFATCGSLADRLAIATAGKWNPEFGLSEQILISCGGDMGMDFYQGCEGGIPHFAIEVLTKEGVPLDTFCLECGGRPGDVDTGNGGNGPRRGGGVVNPNNQSTCSSGGNVYAATDYTYYQTGCDGGTSCNVTAASTCPCSVIVEEMRRVEGASVDDRYKTIGPAHNYTSHGPGNQMKTVDLWPDIPMDTIAENVIRMKKAIYYEGPLTVGYRVTQDFYTYWPTAAIDNYYQYDGRSPMAGGHAVTLVGWRKMADGTPVWIAKNSWGVNGGYGFPDGPKIKDTRTGEERIKYMGGFWNHIMGVNDSFIESNAVGAHPDLKHSAISKHLPNGGADIPEEWYTTTTLRDIYQQVAKTGPTPKPKPKPQPKPSPSPEPSPSPKPPPYSPVIIENDRFNVVALNPDNISPQSLTEFFNDPNNYYVIGANHLDSIESILSVLPDQQSLSQSDMTQLIEQLIGSVKDYIVLAARGDTNNYYYIHGNPGSWSGTFNKTFANRAATLKKLVGDLYPKLESLRALAPIAQVSNK